MKHKVAWVKKHIDPMIEDLELTLSEFRAKSRFKFTPGTIEGVENAFSTVEELSRKNEYDEGRNKIILDIVALLDGFDTMKCIIVRSESEEEEFPLEWVEEELELLAQHSEEVLNDIEKHKENIDMNAFHVITHMLDHAKKFCEGCESGKHSMAPPAAAAATPTS